MRLSLRTRYSRLSSSRSRDKISSMAIAAAALRLSTAQRPAPLWTLHHRRQWQTCVDGITWLRRKIPACSPKALQAVRHSHVDGESAAPCFCSVAWPTHASQMPTSYSLRHDDCSFGLQLTSPLLKSAGATSLRPSPAVSASIVTDRLKANE